MPVISCRIPFESLADYHEGRANAAMAARVRAHLEADCPTCRESLRWLKTATPQIHAAQQTQVPPRLLNRAYHLFRERYPVPAPARPVWQAFFQSDSRSNLAWAGARGQIEGGFQLRFSAEQHDIILFQEPMPNGAWYLIGQVLPKEGDAIIIPQEVVFAAPDGSAKIFAPQTEEFHLPAIPAGIYGITLRLEDGEIVLSDVHVGPQEMP